MSGLRELPGTLAHRSFTVHLRKALVEEMGEDFDIDEPEVEATARQLQERWEAWALTEHLDADLRNTLTKPAKLPELDARRNQIAAPLLRIADLAGKDWPSRARVAVVTLGSEVNASALHEQEIRMLEAVRDVFDGALLHRDTLSCAEVVEALNESEYGSWNNGRGITTRQLGHKLRPYQVTARTVWRGGEKIGNGYKRAMFEDVWSRYLGEVEADDDDQDDLGDW